MPRVHGLEKEYRKKDLNHYIFLAMKDAGITQKQMAEKCRECETTFRNKLKKSAFSYEELMVIFKELGTEDKDILRLMKI